MRVRLVLVLALALVVPGCVTPDDSAEGVSVAAVFLTAFARLDGAWNGSQAAAGAEALGFRLEHAAEDSFLSQPLDGVSIAARAPDTEGTALVWVQRKFEDPPVCTRDDLTRWAGPRLGGSGTGSLVDVIAGFENATGWHRVSDPVFGVDAFDADGNPLMLPERCAPAAQTEGFREACARAGSGGAECA